MSVIRWNQHSVRQRSSLISLILTLALNMEIVVGMEGTPALMKSLQARREPSEGDRQVLWLVLSGVRAVRPVQISPQPASCKNQFIHSHGQTADQKPPTSRTKNTHSTLKDLRQGGKHFKTVIYSLDHGFCPKGVAN